MEDDLSLFSVFDAQGAYNFLENLPSDTFVSQQKQVSSFGVDNPGGIDPFTTEIRSGRVQVNTEKARYHSSGEKSNFVKLKPNPVCPKSFWVLGNFRKRKERFTEVITSGQCSNSTENRRKLSTEDIIRMAGERFIHFSCKKLDGITRFIHPYGSTLSTLSPEDTKMVDLALLLFASAEKVGYKEFDSAEKLLARCECMASESGHPVERVAFHFTKALRERVKTETGLMSLDKIDNDQARDYSGLSSGVDITHLVLHQELPFSKVMQYASIQTILENIAMEKKIHVIDLQLRNGIQWIPLIQALSERKFPVHILKITALQTTDTNKTEETGKRLQSYAKSMNIPFVFKVIFVLNMEDLKSELFNIKHGEAVAVYSPVVLRAMIPKPDNLQILLRVIQRLRPLIMVVCEVEADHNSPSFVNRFIESLFYFSGWFDSLEDCIIDRDNQYRMDVERSYFGPGIQNILATEGEDRITRSVKINV